MAFSRISYFLCSKLFAYATLPITYSGLCDSVYPQWPHLHKFRPHLDVKALDLPGDDGSHADKKELSFVRRSWQLTPYGKS